MKAKEERKKQKEEKKQEEINRKQENKRLYEEEMNSIKSSLVIKKENKAAQNKFTQADIERERQKALMATLMKNMNKHLEGEDDFEQEIEENINHMMREHEELDKERYDQVINANTLDEALDHLDIAQIEKHPEKRVKAVSLNNLVFQKIC